MIRTLFIMIILFASNLLYWSCGGAEADIVTFRIERTTYRVLVSGEGELEAKNAQVLQTPMVWPAPTVSYLIEEGSTVIKGDVIAEFTQTQIENEYLNAQDEVEAARADSIKTEAELSLQLLMYESQFLSANAAAEAAKLQLARIEFEAPRTQEIKRLEIAQFELEAERARKNLSSLQTIQTEERTNAALRIKQAQNKVNRAQEQLAQLTLRAPYDGIVVYGINPITDEKVQEGTTLYPRMPVAKIPDLSVMQVKMQISEIDAQKLANGMPSRITIPSLDNLHFTGKVTRVDRVAKPISRGSKVKKVEVIVELDSTLHALRPGITATVDVIVREIPNMMPLPFETVFERDSVRLVYVKNSDSFDPQPVASLYQDEDFMLVYGNVQEGQELALTEPPKSRVNWPDTLMPISVPAEADTLKGQEKKESPERPEMTPEMMQRLQNSQGRRAQRPSNN